MTLNIIIPTVLILYLTIISLRIYVFLTILKHTCVYNIHPIYPLLGHVDAGKSTVMGHLLYLLGNVSKRAMHKYAACNVA